MSDFQREDLMRKLVKELDEDITEVYVKKRSKEEKLKILYCMVKEIEEFKNVIEIEIDKLD